MFICPSACFRHGALGAVQHGYKDRTSYLYITPADIVAGYDNLILEGADELLAKDKSIKVLFLFVPCMDDFIGTDIESLAIEVQKRHPGIVVRACHMNPIAAETKKPPLVTTMHSMFSAIETKNYASEDAVNLCGSFALIYKECELFDFLGDYGIEVRQLANYETYEQFCEMGRSKYNLIMRPAGKFAAEYARYARLMRCEFLDASQYAVPSKTDALHLDQENHLKLAEAMAEKVRRILK